MLQRQPIPMVNWNNYSYGICTEAIVNNSAKIIGLNLIILIVWNNES